MRPTLPSEEGRRLLDRLSPAQAATVRLVGEQAQTRGVAVYLVGGPVRDLLLGLPVHDLDFCVVGDGVAFAEEFARRHGRSCKVFARFGTAVVGLAPGRHVDFASARSERYPQPGALPEVALPAPLEEDLRRRDFTINAMALSVMPLRPGALVDPLHGRRDLAAGVLRVVHVDSFRDDPNRLLRAAAFAGRLDFALEPETERLLRAAVQAGALETISAQRRNATLRRLLEKPGAGRGLELLSGWGLFPALALGRRLTPAQARALDQVPLALEALGPGHTSGETQAEACLALLLARLSGDPAEAAWALGHSHPACRRLRRIVARLRQPPPVLARARPLPSALCAALEGLDRGELAALWVRASAPGRRNLQRFWRELRKVREDVTGAELEATGLRGAEIAAGLARARALKLDRPEAGRDEQLAAAREGARRG